MTRLRGDIRALKAASGSRNCLKQRIRLFAEAGAVAWSAEGRKQLVQCDVNSSEALGVLKIGSVASFKSDPRNQNFACTVRAELRDGSIIILGINLNPRGVVVEFVRLEEGHD